jgi:hypothetical protein
VEEVIMNRWQLLQPIHFRADTEYLLDKANKLKKRAYTHKTGQAIDNYKFAHFHNDQIQGFLDTMPFLKNCKYRTSFVWLEKDTVLPWHTDKGNKCAVVWGLQGWQQSCTYFRPKGHIGGNRADHERKWVYQNAIIDTSTEHKVVVKSKEKIMFKLSIIDKDFDWVCTNWSNSFKGFKFSQ